MKTTGLITNIYVPAGALYRRRVEKPRPMNDLHDGIKGSNAPVMLNSQRAEKPQMSRFETGDRYRALESGIPARFIAHILGQISETNRVDPMAVTRAYKTGECADRRRFLRFI